MRERLFCDTYVSGGVGGGEGTHCSTGKTGEERLREEEGNGGLTLATHYSQNS